MRVFGLLWALLLSASANADEVACVDDGRCEIDQGYYIAASPPDWDGQSALPVVVYFHGWNSSPEATFRNKAMLRAVHQRGALFVAPYAPHGFWRQIGEGRAESGRDELAYAERVMADLRGRWPLADGMVLASGFSRGASMVWNLACYSEDLFDGYLPIAGAFWHSLPEQCPASPKPLKHIHGTKDKVVSYDRTGIYNSISPVASLDFLKRQFVCENHRKSIDSATATFCNHSGNCRGGAVLEMCMHLGGHSIRAEWVAEGLDWLGSLSRQD